MILVTVLACVLFARAWRAGDGRESGARARCSEDGPRREGEKLNPTPVDLPRFGPLRLPSDADPMRVRQLKRLIRGAQRQLTIAAWAEREGEWEEALDAYEHARFLVGVDPWGAKHVFAENGVDATRIEARIREVRALVGGNPAVAAADGGGHGHPDAAASAPRPSVK